MRDLKVPYALNQNGEVIAALTAQKTDNYNCLECGQHLALRRRSGQRPHFTHLPDPLKSCSGESVQHMAAKHLLKEQLEQELAESNHIRYQLNCPGIKGICEDKSSHVHYLSVDQWEKVELEVKYLDYRLDVAITANTKPLIGFEVFFKHELPEAKAENLNLPWLELLAEDILEYKPRIPHKSPEKPRLCSQCEKKMALIQRRKKDNSERDDVSNEFYLERERIETAWRNILSKAKSRQIFT